MFSDVETTDDNQMKKLLDEVEASESGGSNIVVGVVILIAVAIVMIVLAGAAFQLYKIKFQTKVNENAEAMGSDKKRQPSFAMKLAVNDFI